MHLQVLAFSKYPCSNIGRRWRIWIQLQNFKHDSKTTYRKNILGSNSVLFQGIGGLAAMCHRRIPWLCSFQNQTVATRIWKIKTAVSENIFDSLYNFCTLHGQCYRILSVFCLVLDWKIIHGRLRNVSPCRYNQHRVLFYITGLLLRYLLAIFTKKTNFYQ